MTYSIIIKEDDDKDPLAEKQTLTHPDIEPEYLNYGDIFHTLLTAASTWAEYYIEDMEGERAYFGVDSKEQNQRYQLCIDNAKKLIAFKEKWGNSLRS